MEIRKECVVRFTREETKMITDALAYIYHIEFELDNKMFPLDACSKKELEGLKELFHNAIDSLSKLCDSVRNNYVIK